jgi:hypothetical protein
MQQEACSGASPLLIADWRNEVRELCRSGYIFTSTASTRTYERNPAVSARDKISLSSDENSLDLVGIAVEYRGARVATVGVEVCDKKCRRLVVSHRRSASKLGWQSDRMSDDVNLLFVADFALPAYARERMIGHGTIDADQRPIGTCGDFLAPDKADAAIDFCVINLSLRSSGIQHPETENESNLCDIALIDAVSGSCNDIRRNKKAGTETADRLFAKALGWAQVLRGSKVLHL